MPSDNSTPEVFKIDDDIVEEKHTGSLVLGKEPEPKIKMITDPVPRKKVTKPRKEKSKKSKPKVSTTIVLGNKIPKTKFIKIKKEDIEADIEVKIPENREVKKINKTKSKKKVTVTPGRKCTKNKEPEKQKLVRDGMGRFIKPGQVLSSESNPGRPTKFTQDLADEICSYLSLGESMRTVSSREGMPSMQTMWRWLRENDGFREQYARAKEESADAMAEDILDIADDGVNDWETRTNKRGEEYEVVNKEVVMRSRLRIDTRRWLMSKMKPKKYGDKLDLTSGGDKINNPYAAKTLEELKEIAKEMQSEDEIRSRK